MTRAYVFLQLHSLVLLAGLAARCRLGLLRTLFLADCFVVHLRAHLFGAVDVHVLQVFGDQHVCLLVEVEVEVQTPLLAGDRFGVVDRDEHQVAHGASHEVDAGEELAQLRGVFDVEVEAGAVPEVLLREVPQTAFGEVQKLHVRLALARVHEFGLVEDFERVLGLDGEVSLHVEDDVFDAAHALRETDAP